MKLAVVSLLLVFTTVYSASDMDNSLPITANQYVCASGKKCVPHEDYCPYCPRQRGTVTIRRNIGCVTRYFIFPNTCKKCYDAYCYCRDLAKRYGKKATGKLWEPKDKAEFNWVKQNAPSHPNADPQGFKKACHWWIGATNTPADGNNMRYFSTNNNGPLTMNEISGAYDDCVDIYPNNWYLGDHQATLSIKFICQVDVNRCFKDVTADSPVQSNEGIPHSGLGKI